MTEPETHLVWINVRTGEWDYLDDLRIVDLDAQAAEDSRAGEAVDWASLDAALASMDKAEVAGYGLLYGHRACGRTHLGGRVTLSVNASWLGREADLVPADAKLCWLPRGVPHRVRILWVGPGAFGTQYVRVDLTPDSGHRTIQTIPFDAIESLTLV